MTDPRPARDPDDFATEVLRAHQELIPTPYGANDALDQSGSVATPLFAGFALTVAVLVIGSDDKFRWPDLVLVCLAISFVALLMSVQPLSGLGRTVSDRTRWPHGGQRSRRCSTLPAFES